MSSCDEHTQLVSSDRQLNPVDYGCNEQRQRHRRQLCVTTVVVCCIGVALCLAIALPLSINARTSTASPSPDGQGQPQGVVAQSPVARKLVMVQAVDNDVAPLITENDKKSPKPIYNETTSGLSVFTVTRHARRNTTVRTTTKTVYSSTPTMGNTITDSEAPLSSTGNTLTSTPTTLPWIIPSCPQVAPSRSGLVDMSYINDKVWYELHRVQTYNSPAYVADVSCATMKLTLAPSSTLEAVIHLSWEEGVIFSRQRKSKLLGLQRNNTSSNSWLEWFNSTNVEDWAQKKTDYAQITFLSMIDDFLLVFECFPNVNWRPQPGYVIRVYSSSAIPDGSRIDEALLAAAQIWGLNPADVYPIRIRQRFCDVSVR
jgi:hypothetical protein